MTAKRVLSCALLILMLSCGSSSGATAEERLFLWNEANSIMASAGNPEDYLMAAWFYQNIADRGIRNGHVFYNIGTALLNAGAYDQAVEALLRAERYIGFAPDLNANLAIAMARSAGSADYIVQWYRIPLFWHFRLSTPVRTLVAAAMFSLFWFFLALKTLRAGRWTRTAAVLALFFLVLFGTSAATSLHQEANARRIIVGMPGG